MAWFTCTVGGNGSFIEVTCDAAFAGETITCTDGNKTYTNVCPSSSPYTVKFRNLEDGIWTISGTIDGVTSSISVTIDTTVVLRELPVGATVTPTDDIQTWLKCGNVWDKTYTTINEVLADASTLQTLIASNNAADYMSRSTTWASSVTANASAMTYIGANNYCADKLLADSTWRTAIINSTYFESVLNVKVPTMTSNTTPDGVAIVGNDDTQNALAFKAFDGNDSTANTYSNAANHHACGYDFGMSVAVKKAMMRKAGWYEHYLQYSDDNVTWVTCSDVINLNNNLTISDYWFNINANAGSHRYWRAYENNSQQQGTGGFYTLQFYGRASS